MQTTAITELEKRPKRLECIEHVMNEAEDAQIIDTFRVTF
jgi:hypothetical protein